MEQFHPYTSSSLLPDSRRSIQSIRRGQERPLGAHIVTPRCAYTHHGICSGDGCVVHCGPDSLGFWRRTVEEVSMEEFARGHPVRIRGSTLEWIDRPAVVARGRSRLGEGRYHLLKDNCEHFCEWCTDQHPRSYQMDHWMARVHLWEQTLARIVRSLGLADRPLPPKSDPLKLPL